MSHDKKGFDAVREHEKARHTSHCAARLVFGDGECECGQAGRDAELAALREEVGRLKALLICDCGIEMEEKRIGADRRVRLHRMLVCKQVGIGAALSAPRGKT